MKASTAIIPVAPAIELERILYATDFSDASLAALPLVSTIAHKYGARVFAVNVLTSISDAMVSPDTTGSSIQNERPPEQGGSGRAVDNGYCSIRVPDFGDAAERILAHSESGRADLIGLGVRKAGEIATHFRIPSPTG